MGQVYLVWLSSFVRSVLLVMMAMLRFLKGFAFNGLCVASRNEIDPRSFSLQKDSKDVRDFLQLGTRVQHFGRLAIKTVV